MSFFKYQVTSSFEGHEGKIKKVMFVEPKYIVSASYDNKMIIWDLKKEKDNCVQVFGDEKSQVNDLAKLGRVILAGSSTGTVCQFKQRKNPKKKPFKKSKIFTYHGDVAVHSVCTVDEKNGVFASCDNDGFIFFASDEENKVLLKFQEPSKRVLILKKVMGSQNRILYVTGNELKMLDYKKGIIEVTLKGHTKDIVDIHTFMRKGEEMVITSGMDKKLNKWNLSKKKLCTQVVVEHRINRILMYRDKFMVTGTKNGYVEVLDLKKNEQLLLAKLHNSTVGCLAWLDEENLTLISSGSNHVKVGVLKKRPDSPSSPRSLATPSPLPTSISPTVFNEAIERNASAGKKRTLTDEQRFKVKKLKAIVDEELADYEEDLRNRLLKRVLSVCLK